MKISLRLDKRISYSDLAKRLVSSTQSVTWRLRCEQYGLAPSFDTMLIKLTSAVFSMHIELERGELERLASFLSAVSDRETKLVLGVKKGGSTLPIMRRVYKSGAVMELYENDDQEEGEER